MSHIWWLHTVRIRLYEHVKILHGERLTGNLDGTNRGCNFEIHAIGGIYFHMFIMHRWSTITCPITEYYDIIAPNVLKLSCSLTNDGSKFWIINIVRSWPQKSCTIILTIVQSLFSATEVIIYIHTFR